MEPQKRIGFALLLFGLPALQVQAGTLLVIGDVEVRDTKSDARSARDPRGVLPDLRVSIERVSEPAGEQHITAVRKGTLKVDFNRTAIEIDAGDELQINVDDDDIGADDDVGEIRHRITQSGLKNEEIQLSFDQVIGLTLRLKEFVLVPRLMHWVSRPEPQQRRLMSHSSMPTGRSRS